MAKKIKEEKVKYPEHISTIPLNEEIEKKKKEQRKLIKSLRESMGNTEAVVITADGTPKLASQLSYDEQDLEIAKCAVNPIYFIETYFTIFDQTDKTQGEDGSIVPFKLFSFQKDLVRDYQKYRLNIANKYRQAGISTATSAYIAWYIGFTTIKRNVAIVADKQETAMNEMMKDVVDFLESCPTWLVPQPTKKDNEKHKIYSNNCEIKAFATSGLRGYTPTLLFWDETAWAENSEKFWTATRPAVMNTGGRAIFVSTPNGLDPIFYKTYMAATTFDNNGKKKSKFHAVELWWFNDPRYIVNEETRELDLHWVKNRGHQDEISIKDEDWSKEKRIKMHNDGWLACSSWMDDQIMEYNGDNKKLAQELLCSFLGSGDNFIAEEYLKYIQENQIQTPLRQEYLDNEMYIFEDPEPDTTYIQSIDVSSGHGDDYSTVNIFRIEEILEIKKITKNGKTKEKKIRKHKAVQVAEYYNKVLPSVLGEIGYEYGIRYNNAYTIVDVTGGYGAQTLEKLFELGYENIHYGEITHKPTRDRLNGYIKVSQKTMPDGKMSKIDLIPGFFIGNNRGSVLIEFQRSINMGDVIIRSVRLLDEMKTFVTVAGNRVADHKRSFHDDSIMSAAMALYSLFHELFKLGESKEKTKKMLDAIMILGSEDIIEKVKKDHNDPNMHTRTPDYRVSKQNPYGANSWLFNGLK